MIKKLFWLIILISVLYIITIFKAPSLANSVEKLLGIQGFNQSVISFKKTFDKTVTNLPSKEEATETYEKTISGALDLKNKFIEGIDTTKNKIDSIRETLSGAEDTVNKLKGNYDDAKKFIDEASKKIEDTKKIIDDASKLIPKVSSGAES